ncbi:uncharacterized protein LOC112085481 [Eutrema salsugineum]|uniref:uncharacterized protein LOC112085481 n=1 Tax=Eutrema salsugineum TaxID=72664 RepID=UPI000CED2AEE|nr:uncharacterized protein LOC112085481 [Eutrema salsugineum]
MSSDSSSNSEAAILPEHCREETSTDLSSSGSTEHSSNASLVRKNSWVVEVGSSSRVPIRAPERMDWNLCEPEGQVPTDLVPGQEPDVKTDEDAILREVGDGGAQDPNDDDMMPIIDRDSSGAMLIGGAPPGIIIQIPEPEERPWDAPEDFICVYEAYFREAGLTFPLPRLLFAYCNRRGCAISQLQPAMIVNFVGILQLGRDIHAHINVAQFEELFIMKVSQAKNRHVPGFLQRSLTTDLAKQLSLAGQHRWPRAYQEKIDRRIKRAQERAKTKAEPSSSRPVPKKKNPRKSSKKSRRRMAFDKSDIPMMNFGADEEDNALIDIVGLDGNEVGNDNEVGDRNEVDNVPVGPADPLVPITDSEVEAVGTGVPEATPKP